MFYWSALILEDSPVNSQKMIVLIYNNIHIHMLTNEKKHVIQKY